MGDTNNEKSWRNVVLHALGADVVNGKYRPGDCLPGEIVHSRELGVSRGSYREIIKTLIAKGLLESRTKPGTRVRPRGEWHLFDPDVLNWLCVDMPHRQLVDSLFELRAVIEPSAATIAAERSDDHEVGLMGHALRQIADLTLPLDDRSNAIKLFHGTILSATKNGALVALKPCIMMAIDLSNMILKEERRPLTDPSDVYKRIFQAVSSGNGIEAGIHMKEAVRRSSYDASVWLEASSQR